MRGMGYLGSKAVCPKSRCTLGCLIKFPVPGPGFRSQCWAGCGRKLNANGPNPVPNCPGRRPGLGPNFGPLALGFSDPNRPKTSPGKPGPGTGSTSEQPKIENHNKLGRQQREGEPQIKSIAALYQRSRCKGSRVCIRRGPRSQGE